MIDSITSEMQSVTASIGPPRHLDLYVRREEAGELGSR